LTQKKIILTGGSGRFANVLKKLNHKQKIFYPSRKILNIEKVESIKRYVKKVKPNYLIHCAALSRPMDIHEKKPLESITTNIIGTANIVKVCIQEKIKLIYFSTNYVYPGRKGNYKESDPILPINKYAISKLGGECAVQMYKNSLILRLCMTEKPFVHKEAFNDVEMNFMYHEELAKNLIKLIDYKGIINVGGPKQTPYNFAKKNNKKILSISAKKIYGKKYPSKQSMAINNYLKILRK
jgi:dTDP-4-dehydrorhamnose reductase